MEFPEIRDPSWGPNKKKYSRCTTCRLKGPEHCLAGA